ncbi:MAG: GntR family transcriptional regulator [Pseudomonadota bacterium]
MSPPGALPKYITIAEALARDIGAGRYVVGERLPGERDMAADYCVSVGTLRHALGELQSRGMLRRVQGSGNYVAKSADDQAVYAFFRLEKPDGGGLPTAQVLQVRRDPWVIRRVRLLDETPVALEEISVLVGGTVDLAHVDMSDSLYLTYREELGVFITAAEDQVTVGTWPDWAVGIGPDFGSGPCGIVHRRAFARDGTLAEQSTTWYAPDRAVYTNRFT